MPLAGAFGLDLSTVTASQPVHQAGAIQLHSNGVLYRVLFDIREHCTSQDPGLRDRTMEKAMHPWLFPFGVGAHKTGSIVQYAHHRADMLFSPFRSANSTH